MSYVYLTSTTFNDDSTETSIYTVGHWMPNGVFKDESEHDNKCSAAARCNYLNGGIHDYELNKICAAAEFYISSNT